MVNRKVKCNKTEHCRMKSNGMNTIAVANGNKKAP